MGGLELYDAIYTNDLVKLRILAETQNLDLNAKFTEARKKNHLDLSPIHLVASRGFSGMLQYMIHEARCNIDLATECLRRTALHFAVLRHKVACFHRLLGEGAALNSRDTFGNTPCSYAADDGNCDILDVLIQKGAQVDVQDITLKTPLMKAARNGKLNAVKRLIAAGCALNIRDKNSDVALHFASKNGNGEIVRVLIAAGSGLNIQNQYGRTPLMEAVYYYQKDAVAALIEAGCDINRQETKTGDTAMHIAIKKNYTEVVDQLLQCKDVRLIPNSTGETALYDAIVYNKFDCLKLLIKYNYDLEVPAKMLMHGALKRNIELAIERSLYSTTRLLAYIYCETLVEHTNNMDGKRILADTRTDCFPIACSCLKSCSNMMYRKSLCVVHQLCRDLLKSANLPLSQQTRSTFVLKRQNDIGAGHDNEPNRSRYKAKHFVYDLIEDTNQQPRPPIEVILTENVDGIGLKGDVVTVKRSVFRNQLFPLGQATYASPENLAENEREKSSSGYKEQTESIYTAMTLRQLGGMFLAVPMNIDHEWALNKKHIKVAFRKIGAVVPEEAITLPEEPITSITDAFYVTVTVNGCQKVEVKTMLYPVSKVPGRCPPPELPKAFTITTPKKLAKLRQDGMDQVQIDR
ncbi:unnamed protein product [Owenia fusiformis]|uniref:Ankyrin repeat protein n=1 Tax=Owenia fusiformis TaxID=6347 RepID=A0A8S4P883_OWEFU|nr:unnamed protein product [Owenia fusiformis]